jgi:uncharacterized membrane-anchored protein
VGRARLRWELHTEFVTWTFLRRLQAAQLADLGGGEPPTAAEQLPAAWREALPGQALTGVHLWAVPRPAGGGQGLLHALFGESPGVTGSRVISHGSDLHTDLRLRADGCLRAGADRRRGPGCRDAAAPGPPGAARAGVETYRMAALLGLPAARQVARWLDRGEAELAALAQAIGSAAPADEPALLDRLTRLAAELESLYAGTHTRFSASAAYDELVRQRLNDMAEVRIEGMQSLRDFMDRRYAPAMATCRSADRRQAALSARIARVGDLLRTRVEVEQQQSSRELLAAMNGARACS